MNAIKLTVFGTGLGWRTRGVREPFLTIIQGSQEEILFTLKDDRKAKLAE